MANIVRRRPFLDYCMFRYWRDLLAGAVLCFVAILLSLSTWLLAGQVRKANRVVMVQPMECTANEVKVWITYPNTTVCIDEQEYVELMQEAS